MGIFNNSAVSTALLSPVILPARTGADSNSETMRMMNYQARQEAMSGRQEAAEDGFISKLSGLDGANHAIIQQANGINSLEKQLEQDTFAAMVAPGTTDQQAQQLAQDYYSKKTQLASKKVFLQMHAEVTKSDRLLWEKKWEEMGNEGTLDAPALLADFGGLTVNKDVQGDGRTIRTSNLFYNAAKGLVAADRNGNVLSQGDYMVARSKSTAVDEDGSPQRFRPPVEAMSSAKYMEEVQGLMKIAKGGMNSSNSMRVIAEGNTIETTHDELQKMVNGAGYSTTTVSSNQRAVNDMINNAFDKMSDTAKNAAMQRLMVSGDVSGPIQYGKEKMKPMLFSQVASELQNTSLDYYREKDVAKKEELRQRGMALSATLINGVKRQVATDALGLKSATLTNNVSTSLTRASEQRQRDMTAMTGVQTLLSSKYVESVIPFRADNKASVFVDNGKGNSTLMVLNDSRLGTYPTGVVHDQYMSLLIPNYLKNASGNIASDKVLTYGKLLTKNAIAGGMVLGSEFNNMVFKGVSPMNDVMISKPIENGVINVKAPANTVYIGTEWTIPKEDMKIIKINQFNKYEVTEQGGSSTGQDTTFMAPGFKKGGYMAPLHHVLDTQNNPYGTTLVKNADGTGTLKVMIQVDQHAVNAAKASLNNTIAAKEEMKVIQERNKYDVLWEQNGMNLNRDVKEIDTEMYGNQNLHQENPYGQGYAF